MAASRLLSFQDRNLDAFEIRTELEPALKTIFGNHSVEYLTNRIRIDNLLIEMGRTNDAIVDLSKLRVQIGSMQPKSLAVSFLFSRAIASAYSLAGREPDALRELRSIRVELASSSDDEDTRPVRIDQSIAEILSRLNPSEEALEVASRVFLWRDKHLPPEDPLTLRSLWLLAYLYSENARLETSRAILDLLSASIKTDPSRLPRRFELQVDSLIAEIDLKVGNYIAARDRAEAVYKGAAEIFGAASVDTQTAATTYALALERTGQPDAGCDLLGKVQQELSREQPDDTWILEFSRVESERCRLKMDMQIGAAARLRSLEHSWISIGAHGEPTGRDALNALASYAFALRDAGERNASIRMLEKYVHLAENNRAKAAEGSTTKLITLSSMIFEASPNISPIACYRELALLHAQDNELEQALRVSELARDRTLGDRFAEQTWLRDRVPAPERRRLEPVLAQIQDLDERLAVTPDLMERVRLESQRTIAVAQRGRMEQALRERLHLSEPDAQPPSLDALRAHLASGTVLVSAMHSGEAWWALVVRRDAPARFIALPDPDLGRNASAWVRRLRGEPVRAWPMPDGRLVLDDLRPAGAAGPFLTTAQLANRLSGALLAPMAPALGDARHIVFVGDDELVGVPLQALPLGDGLAVDRYDISYAPSLTTYARWQGRAAARHARDLLAIGDIAYPHRSGSVGDDVVSVGLEFAADHPLPQSGSEIRAIGRLFPAQRQRLMTGSAARKAELRAASLSGELGNYRYVHLATHAWADAERPEASAVVLASDGSEPPLQVVMTAAELAGLRMDADLIVLSACDTGSGHFEHGRGLLGLAYAALAAGNRAAVLSLWSIADATAAPFMSRFYEHLAQGMGPAAALSATQREFRRSADPGRADPAAWAPFLLYGAY